MTFKKHGPGCPCDCNGIAPECLAQCFCAIRIDMPTPDTVNNGNGPTCSPSDCTEAAPCWACYAVFDGIWKRTASQREYELFCSEVGLTTIGTSSGTCESSQFSYEPLMLSGGLQSFDCETNNPVPCWGVTGIDCPDCVEPPDPFATCYAEYSLKCQTVSVLVICDGGCCTMTVEISYVVRKECDEDFTNGFPETTYTHTFQRTGICSCEDMLGALTFVSTTSENNARGITVPDVCNVNSATVTAVGDDQCGCVCFDCFNFSSDINISLTGTEFTGTTIATYEPYDAEPLHEKSACVYRSIVTGATCQFEVELTIECLPCEKYDVTVRIKLGNIGINQCIATYQKLGAACGEFSGFTYVGQSGDCSECDITDFTISLS